MISAASSISSSQLTCSLNGGNDISCLQLDSQSGRSGSRIVIGNWESCELRDMRQGRVDVVPLRNKDGAFRAKG